MKKYLEQILWLTVLLLLFFMDNSSDTPSLCLFKMLGLKMCPGCGIGHAMHDALHLRLADSIRHHILGIPATIIIIYIILKPLFKKQSTQWKHNK